MNTPSSSFDNRNRVNGHVKKCFVCKKSGCWSSKHTEQERGKAAEDFRNKMRNRGTPFNNIKTQQFITEFVGEHDHAENNDNNDEELEIEVLIADMIFDEDHQESQSMTTQYVTNFGEIDGHETLQILRDQATSHALTRKPPSNSSDVKHRYSDHIFQGIIIDTGAARWSTAGQGQFQALQKIQNTNLDTSQAGCVKVLFGIGETTSNGAANVHTPIGIITFHIVPADTPFLCSLYDMDNLQVKFNNPENVLIQNEKRVPIIRKNGHPFMLLNKSRSVSYTSTDTQVCYLISTELRQLHRRFGHPSVRRLQRVLERSGHEVDIKAIQRLSKFCHECQLHGKSPGRFKFILHDDCEFNFSIYITHSCI